MNSFYCGSSSWIIFESNVIFFCNAVSVGGLCLSVGLIVGMSAYLTVWLCVIMWVMVMCWHWQRSYSSCLVRYVGKWFLQKDTLAFSILAIPINHVWSKFAENTNRMKPYLSHIFLVHSTHWTWTHTLYMLIWRSRFWVRENGHACMGSLLDHTTYSAHLGVCQQL